MKMERKFDLEDRLIDFAVLIIRTTEELFNTKVCNDIGGQLVRSGTSPALHYGETQSAESRNDFIHKLKILLKELRESRSAKKIIKKAPLSENIEQVDKGVAECDELISIFVKSIETAKRNLENEKSKKK